MNLVDDVHLDVLGTSELKIFDEPTATLLRAFIYCHSCQEEGRAGTKNLSTCRKENYIRAMDPRLDCLIQRAYERLTWPIVLEVPQEEQNVALPMEKVNRKSHVVKVTWDDSGVV